MTEVDDEEKQQYESGLLKKFKYGLLLLSNSMSNNLS